MRKGSGSEKKGKGWWKRASGKKKVWIGMISLTGICGVCGGMFLLTGRPEGKKMEAGEMSVQETQAKTGTISNTIVGTGNLENNDAGSITIPSGIVIEEVRVESGDHVSAGDVLAVVDQKSVLSAMEGIQEKIEELDEEIDESKDESDTQTLTARVDGRVKKIYIQEEQDVAGCMLENGALMLLSIDGKMAVDITKAGEIAQNDTVTVTLSDGTVKEGTVEIAEDDSCTVTFSDSGVTLDDSVTVTASDGTSLGTGNAYIHQKLEITAAAGTVTDISVSEDEKVYAKTTLLTIDNGGQSLKYQQQMAERESLTESLKKLIALAQDGTITAEADGTISAVNVSAESGSTNSQSIDVSEGSTEALTKTAAVSASVSTTSSGGGMITAAHAISGTITLSAADSQKEETQQEGDPQADSPGEDPLEGNGQEADSPKDNDPEGQEQEKNDKEATEEVIALDVLDAGTCSGNTLVIAKPETGNKPQTKITAEDGRYKGTISWKPEDKTFAAETSYQALVTLSAADGYCFGANSIGKVQTGVLSGMAVSEDGKTISFQITYPFTASQQEQENQREHQGDGQNENASPEQAETADNGEEADNQNTADGGNGVQSLSSNVQSTSSQGSSADSGSTSDSESVESTEVTAFTLASDETMILSVNVDELDINSVSQKQEAKITLDAIEDETFTGTVTKVSAAASSSSGGVAKYKVEVTIPKDDRMKEGMNASATIVIEEKENVVTIPVNALQEKGSKVFVYTQKDSDGNLSGEQEVTTGLSDGDTVEITEGLSEGDTVYYQKTGNTSSQEFQGGFDRMEGGPGGDGENSGGEMPGGDFKGGQPGGGQGQGDMQ